MSKTAEHRFNWPKQKPLPPIVGAFPPIVGEFSQIVGNSPKLLAILTTTANNCREVPKIVGNNQTNWGNV